MNTKLLYFKKNILAFSYLFIFISILLLSFPASSEAQTVTNLNNAGAGSLRDVIAGAAFGATIDFSPALNGGTIVLLTQIDINKDLTINGPGTQNLTVSGGNTTRIFNIIAPASNVAISDLKLANGLVSVPFGGAAILFDADDSRLEINRCEFEFNSSSCVGVDCAGGGGAIAVPGANQDVVVIDSSFNFNSSSCVGVNCFGAGGAMNFGGGNQTLEVHGSTFNSNSSSCIGVDCRGGGGAFRTGSGTATFEFTNCTFAFNTSFCMGVDCLGRGGAIDISGGDSVELSFSTFTSNSSSCAGNGCSQSGASVSNSSGDFFISNNIFETDSPNGNCNDISNFESQGYNIDTDGTCVDGSIVGDKPNTNPLLDPLGLRDNGGPTQTIALLIGSPAIDMANPLCPPPNTDQRGSVRPEGPRCDIGAYEGSVFPPEPIPTLNEWGLIALAGILGIVGFMVIRRRTVSADI